MMALIVPYRDRLEHLKIFLDHMVIYPISNYHIYIIEQDDEKLFNRGKLLNIGYDISSEQTTYICTHDIDLIPVRSIEDTTEIVDYSEPKNPTHLSALLDRYKYKMPTIGNPPKPYKRIFGGVSLIPVGHFKQVNGYSNEYWGWGAEDDDLRLRFDLEGLQVDRRMGKYTELKHNRDHSQSINEYVVANRKRFSDFRAGQIDHQKDGLNNLAYKINDQRIGPRHSIYNVSI